ncbi:membrane hypothetical protein [Candidatus Desulfarcum epimagneticum]|uniref:Uncharacterized protein n=1 Tax=uncultured Desulfobacteraceae bacterium TaxID=218296 RepID=A0A484HJD2_9BACT|nr:membrane hypothetical protein [uncultured Desulfobacteraceae bacterium]
MIDHFYNLLLNNPSYLLFIGFFSLSILYFFNRKTLLGLKEIPKKQHIYCIAIFFLKAFLLALAGTFICKYAKIQWLSPINPEKGQSNILSTILAFIGISLAFLTGIAIFSFNFVYSRFEKEAKQQNNNFKKLEKNTTEIANKIKTRYQNFLKKTDEQKNKFEILEEKIKKQSAQIVSFDIRSELYEKSFRAYQLVAKEKDNPNFKNRKITSVIPDIIPLFSIYGDEYEKKAAFKAALYVIDQKNTAIDLLKSLRSNPKKYIKDEIAPICQDDAEINELIGKIMKKLI